MRDVYSFTTEGLERIALAGLTPHVVWSVLHSDGRLVRQLSASTAAVFGVADGGEYVVVAVRESSTEDNDWDIVGARPMDGDEAEQFRKHTGRMP